MPRSGTMETTNRATRMETTTTATTTKTRFNMTALIMTMTMTIIRTHPGRAAAFDCLTYGSLNFCEL